MRVLVAGAGGQLGGALTRTRPEGVEIVALPKADLDIGDRDAVLAAVSRARPALVINAAAYTQVDAAEQDAEAAERINATAVAHLAEACARHGARLVQVSTDYVFDGSANLPYDPGAATNPLGVYGATKRRGEQAALAEAGARALVVRTSWLYAHDGRNFVTRMLQLMAQRPELGVVVDQVGAPTAAEDLAAALWRLASREVTGLHHWCNSGVASWYDFAVAIGEEALALGLLARVPPIRPIPTSAYPTPARRPAYSVLDKRATEAAAGCEAAHWRAALRGVLGRLAAPGVPP